MSDNENSSTPPQQFDVVALSAQITEAARAAAREEAATQAARRLQEAAHVLTGGKRQDPSEALLESFVADPTRFAQSISQATEERITRRMQVERAAEAQQRAVLAPFAEQYPELKSPTKAALIERLAERNVAQGMKQVDALKAACEETVKDYGLKPMKERKSEQSERYAGLPGTGGAGARGEPIVSAEKSNKDFFAARKAAFTATRAKQK